jgi:hypothetical protein
VKPSPMLDLPGVSDIAGLRREVPSTFRPAF